MPVPSQGHYGFPSFNAKFEDTKAGIRSHKFKRNNTMGKRKKTNNDLQNTTQKTIDSAT
jgi:hypothetical protein